jgi:hypothetical protein
MQEKVGLMPVLSTQQKIFMIADETQLDRKIPPLALPSTLGF